MGKNDFIKLYCFGCGAELQNIDPEKTGYIPKFLEPRIINKIDQMYRNLEYWALKRNITFKDRVLNKLRKIFKKR